MQAPVTQLVPDSVGIPLLSSSPFSSTGAGAGADHRKWSGFIKLKNRKKCDQSSSQVGKNERERRTRDQGKTTKKKKLLYKTITRKETQVDVSWL